MKDLNLESRCIVDSKDLLGEGPMWCPSKQMIYWLDIIQTKIHRFRPEDGYFATQLFSERFTAIALTDGEEWIGLTPKGVVLLNPDSGKWREKIRLETDQPNNRFNDGKCDCKGRYWAGTMNEHRMERPSLRY